MIGRRFRLLVVLRNLWQCSQCGGWFESDSPSQTCGSC